MTITLRQVKGTELTYSELDGNFTDLDSRTSLAWSQNTGELNVRTGTANAPSLEVFRDGIYAWSYPNGQMSQAYVTFDVPLDWAVGTDLYVGVHWSPGNSTVTGTVRFGLEFTYAYSYGPNGATTRFGASQTLYINASQADGVAYTNYLNFNQEADKFPAASVQQNMKFLARVFRDGGNVADTFGAPVFIIGTDFFYQTNKFGTSTKSPPFA